METFDIYVDGRPVPARPGQTIAEAMQAEGLRLCRYTRSHSPRGVFCGMGVCQECRMIVDGVANVRTCMTPARPGSQVRVQYDGDMRLEP